MKISTRARYGARLMLQLALHYDKGQLYLKDIARSEDISEKYLSQIIMLLKGKGLVNSFRGAKGGYILSRSPDKITMKEVIEALEGKLTLVSCVEDKARCPRSTMCVTRGLWSKVGISIANTLSGVTLKDLVSDYKKTQKKEIAYAI
ncbi:MAG: Rrf2 family transcriptional regulator [Candidatus Omnitrophota bacterium]